MPVPASASDVSQGQDTFVENNINVSGSLDADGTVYGGRFISDFTLTLTATGNENTDTTREQFTAQGDGRTSESSFGIYKASTNMVPNGDFEGAANVGSTTGWTTTGVGAAISLYNNQYVYGRWCLRVDLVSATTNAGATVTPAFTVTNPTTYTVSGWIYRIESTATLKLNVPGGGSATFGTALGWNYAQFTYTTVAQTTAQVQVICTDGVVANNSFFIDGIQHEASPYATPYIKTISAAATRAAAGITAPNAQTILDTQQGWVAFRFRAQAASNATNGAKGFFNWQTDTNNRIDIQHTGTQWNFFRRTTASNANAVASVTTYTAASVHTVIMAWTPAAILYSIDGAAFTSTANTIIPTAITGTTFEIGTDTVGTVMMDGEMFWFAAGTGTLANADATTLNGLGNGDPTLNTLPATAVTTFAWGATTTTAATGIPLTDGVTGQLVAGALPKPLILPYSISANNLDLGGIYYPPQGCGGTQFTQVASTTYYQYLGRAKKAYTQAIVRLNVKVAGVTLSFAEVGIFKGTIVTPGTVPLLTKLATANATLISAVLVNTTVTLTGLVVPGDDLWAVVGVGTQGTAVQYAASLADALQWGVTASNAQRPSTATTTTPTVTGAVIPAIGAQFS